MSENPQCLVVIFDDYATANRASEDLISNGFDRSAVQITANEVPRVQTAGTGSGYAGDRPDTGERREETGFTGFLHRLFGQHEHNEETGHYAEAVRRGNAVLTVDAAPNQLDRASEIVERYDPIDVDRQANHFRETGYAGFNPNAPAYSSEEADRERRAFRDRERSIPVVEENVEVGKRAVGRGGVRVYSRTTERPIERDVTLTDEKVRVERRPADRPATQADLQQRDEVIEVVETTEEPVVTKTARVVEEVVIGKESTQRKERVRDTVRKTDVEVEQLSPETRADFRQDFDSRYATEPSAEYDEYDPAYTYGYNAARDPRYNARSWDDIQDQIRTDYLRNNPSSRWDRVVGAIRYGWEKATGKRK
jgi:uncharacterized protein (TIGR02271 family)